ncbi:hypothetical protein RTBOTA2_006209, partial [Rhodotorula toruloides]
MQPGEMAIPSAPLPPVSASSASTVSPASTVRRRPSPSDARSPPRTARTPSSASASSSAPSHSSAFSLRSSTAGSSDHPNLSSSAGSLHKGRASSTSRTRPPGLTITPSGTNLVLAGYPSASEVTPTSSAVATRPASTTRLPPSATAAPVANAASTNPSLLHLKTDKPALAPKVRPLPGPDDERPDIPRARCRFVSRGEEKSDAAWEETPPPPEILHTLARKKGAVPQHTAQQAPTPAARQPEPPPGDSLRNPRSPTPPPSHRASNPSTPHRPASASPESLDDSPQPSARRL